MNELNLKGKTAVITGGAGLICSEMARSLASQGVKTVIIDLNQEAAVKVAAEIEKEFGTQSIGLSASVLDPSVYPPVEKAMGIEIAKYVFGA